MQHALRAGQLRTVGVVFQAEPFPARFGHQPDQVFAHAIAALAGWVSVRLEGRQVVWTEDAPAREKEAQLDGCYVVQSDLPVAAASTQAVHDRYLDLTRVERDFRTLKTGLLEIRPVFLRKANRTRGQATRHS